MEPIRINPYQTRINRYQMMLSTYLVRREKLRQKYPDWNKPKGCPEYVLKVGGIRRRIDYMRQAIRRQQKVLARIHHLNALVCAFMELPSLQNSIRAGRLDRTTSLARKLFFKYGIEQGVEGTYLTEFVGGRERSTASRARMAFTRSFKTNVEHYATWLRFRQYAQERADEVSKPKRFYPAA